jgi:hypothetical protein
MKRRWRISTKTVKVRQKVPRILAKEKAACLGASGLKS